METEQDIGRFVGNAAAARSTAGIFKTQDAASYDLVVDQFDHFTERLTKPLAKRIIALARLSANQRVLDVGTGTGVVALEAARYMRREGKVLGIDLSEGMLATARSKAARDGLANCEFRRMDAEVLEIDDQCFDVVLSLFALLHLPDPLKGLREMFRVLQPGGRLILAVGSAAPFFSLNGLCHRVGRLPDLLLKLQGKQLTAPGFLNHLVEERLPQIDGPEEVPLAHHSLRRVRSVTALVRQAGFKVISRDWAGHQAVIATPEEFWEIQRTFSSIARKRLTGASPERVDRLREEFLRRSHDVLTRGGRLIYPFAAFFVVAQRDDDYSKQP